METITINGKNYKQVERKSSKLGSKMSTMLLTYALVAAGSIGSANRTITEKPKLDIVKEYELILQFKSKLSRAQREYVKKTFNRNFVEIK